MLGANLKFVGIDYGSKLAGTTVIAFLNANQEIEFAASEKNQDADRFIVEWTKIHQPKLIFLDAPLSLPGVYQNLPGYADYFYREADRAVQAMSPLFLGGLTARAMKLKADLQHIGIQTIEIYPSHLAKVLQLDKTIYKKQKEHLPTLLSHLTPSLSHLVSLSSNSSIPLFSYSPIPPSTLTWHHFDALLALLSGIRYLNNQHLTFGNPDEGFIIV